MTDWVFFVYISFLGGEPCSSDSSMLYIISQFIDLLNCDVATSLLLKK